ncbi:Nuclear pore complex, rNup107 component (sc Nup84) [Phaffia rhodozyma]|uniref:Nuclear pore complex protein n=1 Tax=Phaffia rhodozyma TaxID=264483 RepID=A0A0F7SER7_PHARH|nr:Nuclear pore complex, rNup107 component (sc Nup84) [Phaffia rhodozyma]
MDVASSSAEPFQAFASILSSCSLAGPSGAKQSSPELDDLLDDQRGLGIRFASVLEEMVAAKLSPTATQITTEEEIQSLSLELSAWKLMHSLLSDRLRPPSPTVSPQELLNHNPYTPPLTVIQHIISEDTELAEWVLIHRHFMTPDPWRSPFGMVERREGGWVASKAALKRGKVTAGGPRQKDLVRALDPDAPVRQVGVRGGGELAPEDHNHTLSLLPALFTYLRYGLSDECAALCRANDQSWLGASLVGGGSGWWVSGLNEKDEAGMDVEDQEIQGDMNDAEVGNRNRTLWKKIGRAVATNDKLPVYERALYGILTGYLPAVLPVCRSWEDHVWARINARIEDRIDRKLKELGGFWAEELGVPESGEGESEGGKSSGLEEVFKSVMQIERDGVAAAARDPYRMAMMYIILGRTDILFSQFADSVPRIKQSVAPHLYSQLLRFFAHLVLYLRLLDKSPPVEFANIILQAYLDVLEKEGRTELVAVYAGSLGERHAEESYSRFLKDMNPRVSKEEKSVALFRAKENGLDLVEVAKITVRLIMGEAFIALPGLEHPEPDITDFDTNVIEGGQDWILIRSLEWLTVSDETFPEALIQSNALVRYFLASGKVHAAKELLLELPRKLLDFSIKHASSPSSSSSVLGDEPEGESELSSFANEYLQHIELFEVLGALTKCVEMMTTRPRAGTLKIDQLEWQKNFTSLVDRAYTSTLDLLKSDWLRLGLDAESEEESQRSIELARVRHLFVPELVFRVHTLLVDTRDIIPQNLGKALELPVLLANEETKLYVEFIPLPNSNTRNRLADYLDLVSQTSMACLQDQKPDREGLGGPRPDDPFRAPLSFAQVVRGLSS